MAGSFLTARWRHLINITYAVDTALLQPHLPPGLELDKRNGRAFASLVAFDFLNTRLRGIPVPFHLNFPEINLRFYVRNGEERGVVFIKELVPRYCIALVANRIYNEPYEVARMRSRSKIHAQQLQVEHVFRYKGRRHRIAVRAKAETMLPEEDSVEHFFKEHSWGFGCTKKGNLLRYRVEHPRWAVHPLTGPAEVEVDFGQLYGKKWNFLNNATPYSSLLAEGSAVRVYPYKAL